MKKWNKVIKNAWLWITGVATTVIVGLVVEYTKEYPIPGAIWNKICWLWNKFIELMTMDIELWWILIFIAAMLILHYVINNIEIIKTETEIKKGVPQPPKFLSYKREVVDNIPWEWSWEQTSKGWIISNLHPCCPKDGARLNHYSDDCPICKTNYWGVADHEKAAAIIENKLKKEFQNNQQFL